MFFLKQQLRVCTLTKRSSRVSNWLVGAVMCFLYLTKPTVVFSSTFSRAFSPTFYPTLIADEVAAFIYLFPIIKLGFQDSNLLLAEPSVEQQTKQVINPQLPLVIKPRKYSPPLSFSDHTGLQQAGARHFYQRIHVYPVTGSGRSLFATPGPDDCTNTEAPENTQYQLEREQRTFSSFRVLLTIPELWSKFISFLPVYHPDTELVGDKADAKCVVLNNPELRELFLLINNIKQIPLTAARNRAESTGSRTAAALIETIEEQGDAATTSEVRNIAMENSLARCNSVMSVSGREYRNRCGCQLEFISALNLYREGFYYSYAHQQLECFSCGGVLDPEKASHCSSLRELHGKFYPNCRFLLQQAGEEYVSFCQQNLTDEEFAIVPLPLPDNPDLYSEPISGDDIVRDLAGTQSDVDQVELMEGRVPGISRMECSLAGLVERRVLDISGQEFSVAGLEEVKREYTEQWRRHYHRSGRRVDCANPFRLWDVANNDTPARAGNASVFSGSDIRPFHRGLREPAFQNIPAYRHSREGGNPPRRGDLRLHGDEGFLPAASPGPESVQGRNTLQDALVNHVASIDSGLRLLQRVLSRESPPAAHRQESIDNLQHDYERDTGRNPGHGFGQWLCADSAASVRTEDAANNDTPASVRNAPVYISISSDSAPTRFSGQQTGADSAAPVRFGDGASNDTPARAGNASVASTFPHSQRVAHLHSLQLDLNTVMERLESLWHDREHDTGRNSVPCLGQRLFANSAASVRFGDVTDNNANAHVRNASASFDSDIRHLQRVLGPESFQALRTLRERIENPRHYHERDRLRQNILEIANNLNSLPQELCRLVGTEITAMIAAIHQGDCQDHTSEVLDQIRTRVTFAVFRHELQTSQTAEQPVEIFDVFDRLKMFFNESVLYELLGEFEEHGEPLVQRSESTEIRSYLKNRFSGICRFPGRNILQAFRSISWLSNELMDRVEQVLIQRISNPTGFVRYLTDLFSTDTVFLDYIKQHDEHFAEWYNDIVTTAYSDLEQYSSGNPELSEQEVLEGTARVNADRTEGIAQLVQGYAETQVVLFWDRILENERLQNQRDHE